jgi:putative two-component system response regulator
VPDQKTRPVILAVDDTPENLDTVKSILVPDYIVKAAINGMVALKIAGRKPPDLILLDIMMPGMDGYEVCRQLKSDNSTAHIPVIFLSGDQDSSSKARGLELGAADFVTKPIDPVILKASIRKHLGVCRI